MVLMLLFQNHTLRLNTTALDDITYQIFKMLFLNSRVKKKLAGVISETNSEIRLTVSHKTALIQGHSGTTSFLTNWIQIWGSPPPIYVQ